jgi:hypothetical protein
VDLIAQAIGAVLAFFASIIGNIFAHDICSSADSVCAKIIKAAAVRLAPFDRDSTEREWLADLHEYQTVAEKYRHAVGCFLAAPGMRRFALKTPPFIAEAPGLVWKERRRDGKRVWEARWACSPNAIGVGYVIKSVKLWTGYKAELTAEERDFLVDVTRDLQAEHDRWLYDSNYRMRLEAKAADREQKIQKLIALGHTRAEAVDALFPLKSGKKLERRGQLRPRRKRQKLLPPRP